MTSQTSFARPSGNARPFLKPGWTPTNTVLMVVGFVFFWPLGLAMLGYNIWGHRMGELTGDLKRQFSKHMDWNDWSPSDHSGRHTSAPTGNAAFDAYRARELARLEEERTKIEAMRREFDTYMETLRQARDQEEFDRFMADRKRQQKSSDVTDL